MILRLASRAVYRVGRAGARMGSNPGRSGLKAPPGRTDIERGMSNPFLFEMRRAPRTTLEPMYHGATVHMTIGDSVWETEGHLYDLSLVGARLEVDEMLVPGQAVTAVLHLPGSAGNVHVSGTVVRVYSPMDDPGPRRVGVRFDRFLGPEHEARLRVHLGEAATPHRRAA